MKALSIRPPWAYFVIYDIPYGVAVDNDDGSQRVEDSGKVVLKNVENRNWPLPKDFKLPQRVYVQVSTKPDPIEAVMDICCKKLGLPYGSIIMGYSTKLPRGAIIGEVDITGCVTDSKSPWAAKGQYHFVLSNPKPYEKPIKCKGRLGFFEPTLERITP